MLTLLAGGPPRAARSEKKELLMDQNLHQPDFREIRIESAQKWGIVDISELLHYRDLLFFLIWRGIKVTYAQSVGGYAWAVIQPAMQIILFSLVFGGLIGLDADGIPYPLFTTVAVIPWGYMQNSLTGASNTLVNNSGMLAKIYFPRLIFLLTPVLGNLVPFGISLVLLVAVLVFYQVPLTLNIFMLPVMILLMVMAPLAFGTWMSSLAIRFRDVKIAMDSFLRMLIYLVPVMYPSSQVPEHLRQYYILNPFVGIIEGFKSCLLGVPFQWDSLIAAAAITVFFLLTGAVYFRRMERVIVDVV